MKLTDSHPWLSHSLTAFDKQLQLAELTGNADWQFDLTSGLLSVGDRHRWQTQLLGTESETTGTWLWAWANTAQELPFQLLIASRVLKVFGERHSTHELTQPQLPLDQADGHALALLASGICEANAYYRCPYEGGALFLLVMDDNFPKCADPPLQRLASVFPRAVSSLDISNHRLALIGYLDYHNLGYEPDGDKIVVRDDGEPALTGTFDEFNRLTRLEVHLKPAERTDKSSAWEDELFRRMLGG